MKISYFAPIDADSLKRNGAAHGQSIGVELKNPESERNDFQDESTSLISITWNSFLVKSDTEREEKRKKENDREMEETKRE